MNEQLKIVISAEVDKLKKGCQEATKSIKDVGETAEQTGGKSDSAFSKLGNAAKKAGAVCAKALAAGITAAATGVVALTKAAVQSYAEYEQLVGGVETLFKSSAGIVQGYAENAWKTAGLSANKYMETVTGFSASLLQSLGGDTAEAAKVADMAITDMADNANKMGSSMESIQNAYQGFAKQNYTMLDNLKLGYGGTKEEMQRLLADAEKLTGIKYDINNLSDVYEAIHVIQGELGITGTTAEEAAKTIAGSTAAMKAAWQNLVVGIADDNADFSALIDTFVESAGTAMDNILPRVEIALQGIAALIEELLPVIAARIPEILNSVLPQILSAGVAIVTNLLQGIVETLPTLIQAVVNIIPQLLSSLLALVPQLLAVGIQVIAQIIQGLAQMLPTLLTQIVEIVPQIITALLSNIGLLLEAAIELFMALVEAIPEILPVLIDAIPDIIDAIVTTLIANQALVLDASIEVFLAMIDAITQSIPQIVAAVPRIISAIVNAIKSAIPQILKAGVEFLAGMANGILQAIPKVVAAVGKVVSTVKTNLVDKLKSIIKFDWSLPKLKMPKVSISGKFSLNPPSAPKFSISWNKLGGIFDKPTLFNYGGSLQGIGEDGAEAVVPLEKNTQWLDRIADRLAAKQNGIPIVLQVDGKTFAQVSIDSINALTKQRGTLGLNLV